MDEAIGGSVGITVGELLETPHLGLTLVAGGAGLGRTVRWAHVAEEEDPTPWLEGGELVMTTGAGVPVGARGQRAYLARLDQAGIAGLAISRDMDAPPITPGLKAEADRRAFAVLEVSIEVPFVAIAHAVAAAAHADGQERLLLQLRVFDTLRASTTEGLEARELFARLEALVGCRLYLASTTGGSLIEGVPGPPPELVAKHLPRGPGLPPWIDGGYIVSVPFAHGVAGHLFVMPQNGDGSQDPAANTTGSAGLTTAQHVATIAALELAGLFQQRELLRRHGAETLAELLAASIDTSVAVNRLSLAGFDPDVPLVLIAVGTPSPEGSSVLAHRWEDLGCPFLMVKQRDLYALVPAGPEPLRVVEEASGTHTGVSRPFTIGDGLAVARHEAQWALVQAVERDVSFVRFPEDDVSATWLPAQADVLRDLVGRMLGPVLAYDEAKGSELLASLRVWLEQDRRTEPAAKLLQIHKHTLVYRLQRVEELTGRDLSRMEDVVDLWLALRAETVIGSSVRGPR